MKAQVEQNWLDCLLACAAHAVNMEEPNCREWSFGSNRDYHPIFYGCYDWHSAVHSHWLMAHSLVHFPSELPGSAAITRNTLSKETVQKTRELLITRLTAQNAQKELNTIRSQYPEDWEMPYGVAWFFKLRIALHDLSKIYTDLLPAFNSLENLDAHFRYLVQFWLKSITSPITNGKHDNTAFALSFILEYARHFRHDDLEHRIQHFCEKHFFPKRDLRDPPAYYDFLSPSLSVYELVSRFGSHPSVFDLFPQLSFPLSLFPIVDLDGENGQPCHLIGLNFARFVFSHPRLTPLDVGVLPRCISP